MGELSGNRESWLQLIESGGVGILRQTRGRLCGIGTGDDAVVGVDDFSKFDELLEVPQVVPQLGAEGIRQRLRDLLP